MSLPTPCTRHASLPTGRDGPPSDSLHEASLSPSAGQGIRHTASSAAAQYAKSSQRPERSQSPPCAHAACASHEQLRGPWSVQAPWSSASQPTSSYALGHAGADLS